MGLRQTKSWTARMSAVLLAVVFCFNMVFPVMAEETGKHTIRISYGYSDYLKMDGSGAMSGHFYEYLSKLAEINNWNYEYVEATWPESVAMLESGKIDFLFPVNYTSMRDERMDFSTIPVGYTATGVFALRDSDYDYENYKKFDGARVAFAKNSSNELEFSTFARKNNFSYKPVYIDTNDDIKTALIEGRADLAIFSAANTFPEGVLVSIMEAKPVYFAVQEGNTEMLSLLNQGMQTIIKTDPDLVTSLFRKTLTGDEGILTAMTEEEKQVIDSGEAIRIGFYEETEPLAYVKEDGTYGGIYNDILMYLKEKAGLNLELCPISRDRNWKDLLRLGEIDFYIGSSQVIVANDDDIRTTDSFMDYANVLITKADCVFANLDTPTIALTNARANWAEYLSKYLGVEPEIKFYRTARECMLAVVKGEVDASLINNLEFNYQSKNPRLSSLILWAQYRFPTAVGFAAGSQIDDTLFSAFNKAIGYIDSDYVDVVTDEWLSLPYHTYTTDDIIYNARIPLIIVGCCVLILGVASFLIWIFRRGQRRIQDEAREKERRHLQILAATSYDYSAIYYVDLDDDRSEPINQKTGLKELLGVSTVTERKYSDALRIFVNKNILPEDRESILACADKNTVIARFRISPQFSIRYQIIPDVRRQTYFEMHFIQLDDSLQGHRMMVMGIRCIDEIVQEEQKQKALLQDMLDSANAANTAKSEFLSRMSHDIRTPMNAIIGMTAIASAHAEDPARVRDALEKITGSSRYLLSLINDVLDMSKIETGKLSLAKENINLPELIYNVLNIIQPQMKEHRHTLNVNIRNISHEKVIGDSLRIQQVLQNLLSNAVKYTPDGGTISLKISEKEISTSNAGCYVFVLSDNGIGMDKEFLEHVFEPFSRAEDLRVSKIQGTGLGLAITRNIVQMMNGTIEISSEPGKGSTFTVTMFLKFQEVEDEELSDLKGLSVLVADDNADTCESIRDILSGIGVNVEAYTSGRDAVEAVRRSIEENRRFQAAILDWKMPGIDGLETVKEIRELTGEDLPVIILSGYDWSEIQEEAASFGVTEFLSKPVFKSGIIRGIRSICGGEHEKKEEEMPLKKFEDYQFSSNRILLVEDNVLNREIAKEILEMAGLTVEEAENGKVALDMFTASESGYYDMILMDIQMPVMNGYDCTKSIRELDRADALVVPIVAMSANAFVEDMQKSRLSGMNEHLAKPIDLKMLASVLDKYLK